MKRDSLEQFKNQRGAVAVVVGILIFLLVALSALAIDIGYTMVNKNELQNVADSAALAATRELGAIYTAITNTADQLNYVMADTAPLVAVATQVADKNHVAGDPISISSADVRVGHWNGATFEPTFDHPNAVNVTVRRDTTANGNGPISTFMAGVMGISSVSVSSTATASLMNTLKIPPGGIHFPIGLSQSMFNGEHCGKSIAIYSTSMGSSFIPPDAGCAAWNTLMEPDAGADTMRRVLTGLTNRTYQSPEMIADLSMLNFTNGNQGAQTFQKMADLFESMRNCHDPSLDSDDNPDTWTTITPVYGSDDCNPSGWVPIKGFATITVTGVDGPPDMVIHATINCDAVIDGVSGGVDFGTLGAIPNLVQ